MYNFKFVDFTCLRYSHIGDFHEDLAFVQKNETGLYGFIDVDGCEVISCKYRDVENFNDGLAPVLTETGWGYIDQLGNMVISPKFKTARKFSCGYAVVQTMNGFWGYIDIKGDLILEELLTEGFPCTNEKILFNRENTGYYFDRKNIKETHGKWISGFEEGYAILENEESFIVVDEKINAKVILKKTSIKEVGPCRCGMFRIVNKDGRVGYMNTSFKMQIPCMYLEGRDFSDDMAVIKMSKDVIGFIDKDGVATAFMRGIQYDDISDFKEEVARIVKSKRCGFIDKSGKEIIPCKYENAGSFSEGLASAFDGEDFIYINKNGKKVFTLPRIYYSSLNYGGKLITIKSESRIGLHEEKLKTLENVKRALIKELEADVKKAIDEENKNHFL